jgi:uncharacterized cupin superfamily protein
MANVTVKSMDEFDGAFGGAMKLVRHGLGVTSFGIQVMDFPPGADQYPDHDHSSDGQEEVYTVLAGAATLQVDGTDYELTPGVFARVGAGTSRKIVTKSESARILAVGGIPGKAYEVSPFSEPQAA